MKLTLKSLIIALLFPATICFTACDTDMELIDQQIVKPEQQDPEQYAAYLAALRTYKASDHFTVIASHDNAPAVPGSERAFLRSLPDSLDIVILANADKMSAYDIEDLPGVQAKGTKILYGIDYNVLSATMDAAAFDKYLDQVKQQVVQYGLDGVSIRYDGPMSAAAGAASTAFVDKFSTLSGKVLVAEGNPIFIAKQNQAAITFFMLNNIEAINLFNLRKQIDYAIQFAGIPAAKIILTAEPAGKLTDDLLVAHPAVSEVAKSVIVLGPLAGVGVYHVGDDYFDAHVNYKQTKQAINLLNPAYSK